MAHYESFMCNGELESELVPDCDEDQCTVCFRIFKTDELVSCDRCGLRVCVRCTGTTEHVLLTICVSCAEQMIDWMLHSASKASVSQEPSSKP